MIEWGGAGPEVRLQQGLHRAQHLLVLLGAVVDSCCGSEVRDELGGVYLLLLGAALLRHLDGFTQDDQIKPLDKCHMCSKPVDKPPIRQFNCSFPSTHPRSSDVMQVVSNM